MGQEFFIKSADLENKIRDLLPSQGGLGAGFDLSASTQIIPIVDLTESAEGSNLRQDLQTAFGINVETYSVTGTTTTILTTTGYFRLFGTAFSAAGATTSNVCQLKITDGVTTKNILNATLDNDSILPYDFNIFLRAGESCVVSCGTNGRIKGAARQIADIDGNLIDP